MLASQNCNRLFAIVAIVFLSNGSPSLGQITSNDGDGVLNAPYRGTISSLRDCSMDVAYGEVMSHVEPDNGGEVTSPTIKIWSLDPWDRSVLRLYEHLDAAGDEIDLTSTLANPVDENNPIDATVDTFVGISRGRFSLKAIGTKTLLPQTFQIRFSYDRNNSPVVRTLAITVAPIAGSFCDLPGESEAFHHGTPLLSVSVGNAGLTIPAGQTADVIGAAFSIFENDLSDVRVDRQDVVFPGTAESVHIHSIDQFRDIGTSPDNANNWSRKTANRWGTPWPGYLIGYKARSSDIFGPDGTHYDNPTGNEGLRRFERIRPLALADTHKSVQVREFDNGVDNRVTVIRDNLTTPNSITLNRNPAGFVDCITTSDGRSWKIEFDAVEGWITAIRPGNCASPTGKGARFFGRNAAGRIDEVRDANNNIMYSFVFADDADDLQEEQRFIDAEGGGNLQIAIEHLTSNGSLHIRREFTAPGVFRQFDFAYDTANGLDHRLASITSYDGLNAAPPTYTTTFIHDIENRDGTMNITQVNLPDGSMLVHEYDSHAGDQVGGPQGVEFGFRTKTTRQDGAASLVLLNREYELFFKSSAGSSIKRLFKLPRVVKVRDGRFPTLNTEVVFNYEQEGSTNGSVTNRLLSSTGPTITQGSSGTRTPLVTFTYDPTDKVLTRQETTFASGQVRAVDFGYDALLRQTSQTVDPGGTNLVSQSLFCDTLATQDRLSVDADGYWLRTQFDNDGRVTTVERFLTAGAGNLADACAAPAMPVYRVTSSYDVDGRLNQQLVENKDQDGASLTPATIATDFVYDRLGRLTLQTLDPGGIGQASNFDCDWQGAIERQFDTSGRGFAQTFDGRGLVDSRTPLALGEAPDTNLTTTFQYDAVGNLRFTNSPTGAIAENVYDEFDRVTESKRNPGPDGGNVITATLTYDAASNITGSVVNEATVGVLSDSTALFDEGGFNYETRQRIVTGVDGANDPVSEREFDWSGNVTVERSLGDATVGNRVITTIYDTTNRVDRVQDSEGGEMIFVRDGRGNATEQTVKLTAGDNAVTTSVLDALSRAIQITHPEDSLGGRADRMRSYDSRGNLLRETQRDAADAPKMTTVFAYDNAGRQTRSAVLASAASASDAAAANTTTDRVADSVYDADGRVTFRHRYNNNAAIPLTTTTIYDALGRVNRVTDPSNSYTENVYTPANGRLASRNVFDGVGIRATTFAYDGHDRVTSQTRLGSPNLTTTFALDGLDRQIRVTDPKGIASRTDYDLVGRRVALLEAEGDTIERQTDFAYNRLSQLTGQTARNKANVGTPLTDQDTIFRFDSLGRPTRTVLPDADAAQHIDPNACTDCVRMVYDLAGRMITLTDQRALVTAQTYDDRGLLLTRTTGTDIDTFNHDALGRTTLAQRGTTTTADAVSESVMAYTDLGDLDFEMQTIAAGTLRTVDYAYDQAGNRIQLTYPGGETLAFTPTPINQVDAITLDASPLVDYAYQGRLLDTRTTTTDDPGGNTFYEYAVGYDSHRRINAITNRVQTPARAIETIADYSFAHDNSGNPLTQTVLAGMTDFANDDRVFTVDRLDRLTDTSYLETGTTESTTLDLVGNRESHTNRAGDATSYALANAANEYASVGGTAVSYDAAGNLSIDEGGRQYTYDERNRLTQIQDAGNVVLADYIYDAFGRRIEATIGGVTTRYYYDGQSVIEERDGSALRTGARLRYHVNGSQFIDERVTTFDDTTATFTYYLPNRDFSITGTGNADGTTITRLDFSASGDFIGGGGGGTVVPLGFFFDADGDGDIDLEDYAAFESCLLGPEVSTNSCDLHDWDGDGDTDLSDYAGFQFCYSGDGMSPPSACLQSPGYQHDADFDGDVDAEDWASFQRCYQSASSVCTFAHDYDDSGLTDGTIDLADHTGFAACFNGPNTTPPPACQRTITRSLRSTPPPTGTFALHGRPVDVLPDGKTLLYVRARYYDPVNGRWLQRDPKGNIDGPNLYESFGGNAARNLDPMGTELLVKEDEKGILENFFGKENVSFTLVGRGIFSRGMFAVAVNEAGVRSLGDYVRLTNGSSRYADDLLEAIGTPFYRWEDGLNAFNRGQGRRWIGQRFENRSAPGVPRGMVITAPGHAFSGSAIVAGYEVPVIRYDFTTLYALNSVLRQTPKLILTSLTAAAIFNPIPGDEVILGGLAVRGTSRRVLIRSVVPRQVARVSLLRPITNPARLLSPPQFVPNAGGKIVSFVTTEDRIMFRVFSGNATRGRFLTAIPPRGQAFAQEALALPRNNTATFVQEVLVPAGTRLQRSRALPIRYADDIFPLRRGGAEQFQLLDPIPNSNFGPGVPVQ